MSDPDRTQLGHPAQLGKYEVRRILGKGAMGVVYEGWDPTIRRAVAIKTIHAALLDDETGPEFERRFQREAAAAGRCLHPNIVAVFDYGKHEGTPYLAMEFVEGVEVKSLLAGGPLDLATALSIQIQLLDALACAHGEGVIHRDIKPGNMIQLASGLMKVADFGIARLDATSMTQEGALIGTPSHMSPEQFKGGELDHRADIYSAGVVLFQLLTGTKPYVGRQVVQIMGQVINDPVPDPRERGADVSQAIVDVINTAMAKDPERRYPTAGDFAAALEAAAPGAEVVARPAARATRLVSRDTDGTTSAPAGWDAEILEMVIRELTEAMGPIARVLVHRHAAASQSLEALYEQLAARIPDDDARARFLKGSRLTRAEQTRVESATATTKAAPARFASEVLDAVAKDLAHTLGPIARVLVKKTAGQACSLQDLYQRLSHHIDAPADREAFLDRMPDPPGA